MSRMQAAIGSEQQSRLVMLEKWREGLAESAIKNIEPLAKRRTESMHDIRKMIRNRETDCPTCSKRKYKDASNDSGVSFQAPRHVPAPTSGLEVLRHELEHCAANRSRPVESDEGEFRTCTISLRHAACPECGRNYVAGGVTKTVTHNKNFKPVAQLDNRFDFEA